MAVLQNVLEAVGAFVQTRMFWCICAALVLLMMLFAYRRLNRVIIRNEQLGKRLSQCLVELNQAAQNVTQFSDEIEREKEQQQRIKKEAEREKRLEKNRRDEEIFSSVMQELLS